MRLYLVDVFAETRYSGNQLAVVRDSGALSTTEMQRIAKEMHFSHRYFGDDKVDVRVEQGYEVGRKSLLLLRAKKAGTKIEVNVGGRVQFVAHGELKD